MKTFSYMNGVICTFLLLISYSVFADWTDISSNIEITKSRPAFDRVNRVYFVHLDVKNTGDSTLNSPFRVLVDNSTIPVTNQSGNTESGVPFVDITNESITANETVRVRVDFLAQRKALSFDSILQVDAPTLYTGIVVDSQIIGLRYKSTSPSGQVMEGVTNSKGEYKYFEKGITEFFVGEIKVGTANSKKYVAITTLFNSNVESENLAVFLQTIDHDSDPVNGIEILPSVDHHAKRFNYLTFDETFNDNFEYIKPELFKHTANLPATVSVENAIGHASKSSRLSSLNEFDLYKAIANEKNYRSGDYYNADVLENDQRKRVYLWIWEKLIAKEMEVEDELQFSKPSFDLENVEQTRNQIKKYLTYAESVMSIASLGKGTHENLTKSGGRTMSYNFAKLTSLTVGGCDAVVKLYDADTGDTLELSDNDLCKNMISVLNPVGDSTSKLAIANPIMSSFLPELLPKLIHAQKMNWLHFNTKSLRTISKMKVSKPDVISIALSIAQIANDFGGAYWASTVNEELTTRMVAREWLSLWYRSGTNQAYMNKLINNNSVSLKGTSSQVEAIALKLGSTGALCDTYEFFNPFYECTGIENINYDHEKAMSIIREKLSKSSELYKSITKLTGSNSNESAEIGVIELDWVEDANVDLFELISSIDFDDSNFEACVLEHASTYNVTKIDQLGFLNCDNRNIYSTKGLERLTNLGSLSLNSNHIYDIDVTYNKKLTYLGLRGNGLSNLDITKNVNLTALGVWDNNLTTLNISQNRELDYLGARNNQLSTLDVSNNLKLTQLLVDSNKLAEINLSSNHKLSYLSVGNNNLSTLQLSSSTKLQTIDARNNQFTSVFLGDLENLETLIISRNQLSDIDVKDANNLKYLMLHGNNIKTINLDSNRNLDTVWLQNNPLTEVTFNYLEQIDWIPNLAYDDYFPAYAN